MERVTIADLEAELGCFLHSSSREGPGQDVSSIDFYEPPANAKSQLTPKSLTKTVYPFGDGRSMAWASPCGELVQVASCVNRRLVAVESKKSLELGEEYGSRAKVLLKAVKASQGSGHGLGISLGITPEEPEVHWIHNKWPRFSYKHKDVDVQIQYYIDSGCIVQQLQLRNKGAEEASIPYTVSSDISFREHGCLEAADAISTGKTPERMLLFQNSMLLLQSKTYKVQFEVALFCNGDRQAVWSQGERNDSRDGESDSSSVSSHMSDDDYRLKGWEDIFETDFTINKKLSDSDNEYYRRYYKTLRASANVDEAKQNLASYNRTLVIPSNATQEVCAVFKMTKYKSISLNRSMPLPWEAFKVRAAGNAPTSQQASNETRTKMQQTLPKQDAKQRQRDIALSNLPQQSPGRRKAASESIDAHVSLGRRYVKLNDLGQARFHFFLAILIAKATFRETSREVCGTSLIYAKFLYANSWRARAWQIVEGLSSARDLDISILVEEMLAAMHVERGNLGEAEKVYQHLCSRLNEADKQTEPEFAQLLERVAWTQANQGKNNDASAIYSRLRGMECLTRNKTLLSNLAFLKQRVGETEQARDLYRNAMFSPDEHPTDLTSDVFARSGLYNTLLADGNLQAAAVVMPGSLARYIDVNAILKTSDSPILPLEDRPIHFALQRQLEYQLSACSVFVDTVDGAPCVALVDGDPLNSCFDSRGSYYQFKFLLQCRVLLDSLASQGFLKIGGTWYESYSKRIEEVVEGHLNWIFKVVSFEDTWRDYYPTTGDPDYEKNVYLQINGADSTIPRTVAGASHYLKLYFYFCLYPDKWLFVLRLLALKLDDWLSYLARTKHKSNLWMADETLETLWLRDMKSGDSRDVDILFPGYELSTALLLWLALARIEKLIGMVETNIKSLTEDSAFSRGAISMAIAVRSSFERHREKLDPVTISHNIVTTFQFSRSDLSSPSATEQDVTNANRTKLDQESFSPINQKLDQTITQSEAIGSSDKNANSGGNSQKFFAFRRSVKDLRPYLDAIDGPVLEALSSNFFNALSEEARTAWNATLDLQQDNDFMTFKDPRSFAIVLLGREHDLDLAFNDRPGLEEHHRHRLEEFLYDFGAFSQSINHGIPEPMASWSTVTFETSCMIMESLFKECREIALPPEHLPRQNSLPRTLELPPKTPKPRTTRRLHFPRFEGRSTGFSKVNLSNVVDDATFLPDWLYHYPDFIHETPLELDTDMALSSLEPSEVLQPAVARWTRTKGVRDEEVYGRDSQPQVVDLGVKTSLVLEDTVKVDRKIKVVRLHTSNDVLDYFREPRMVEFAKKRLIELPYCSADTALTCWLAATVLEKPFLLDFFRRHTVAHNYFGERAHQLGNIWETEFHLAFYQMLDFRDPSLKGSRQLQGRPRVRELPTLTTEQSSRQFTAAAMGFRFVGDLRDRFWTCHFVARNYRSQGFTNIIDDKRSSWAYRYSKEARFLDEKLQQRKVVESTYIDKATWEMKVSIGDILDVMTKELRTHDTRDPQGESFELIYSRSHLYFRSAELLRDMLQRQEIAVNTIVEWENREETRGVRSRWSRKDEERFGEKIRDTTRQIRINVQQLKAQRNRIQDLLRFAEQRHTDLIGYMQLREARTSTRSAEDVRLFTYVTIIFLPLSFSSSLFSMAGPPEHSTVVTMVQVTIVALAITVLFLANMKLLDRYWVFWADAANQNARKKMKRSNHTWPIHWNKVSHELQEAAQRQLSKRDYERRLPAESRWWYFWFWISYIVVEIPASQVSSAIAAWKNRPSTWPDLFFKTIMGLLFAPTCLFIFIIQYVINAVINSARLLGAMASHWKKRLMEQPAKKHQRTHSQGSKKSHQATVSYQRRPQSYNDDSVVPSSTEPSSKASSYTKNRNAIFKLLNKPPQPFSGLVKSWSSPTPDAASDSTKVETNIFDDDLDDSVLDSDQSDTSEKKDDAEDEGIVDSDDDNEDNDNDDGHSSGLAAVARRSAEGSSSSSSKSNEKQNGVEPNGKPASSSSSQRSGLSWRRLRAQLGAQGPEEAKPRDDDSVPPV